MSGMRKSSFETRIKWTYVKTLQSIGRLVDFIGLGAFLRAHQNRRWVHWLYSLTAIHDVDRMIALDVPWWTYAAIDKVDQFLSNHKGARVFEYGSGASTVWLSKRALSVTSVEHDNGWYKILESRLIDRKNIDLMLRPPKSVHTQMPIVSEKSGYADLDFTDYLYAVKDGGQPYDLIIIDGRIRSDCLRVAIQHLSKNGMIVFDNSARDRYQSAIQRSGGLIDCQKGFVPSLPYRDETTLITFPKGQS